MRTQQKQQTRRRILNSATRALRTRGLGSPSVGEVMGDAGLTVGGFYAHFDSKDALMLEALEEVLAERRGYWEAQVPAGTTEERRKLAARGYLSRKHRDMGEACCPLPAILAEIPHLSDGFRAVLERHLQALARQMTAGNDAPEERRAALADLATMVGGLTLARALGPTAFSDEILSAAKSAIR